MKSDYLDLEPLRSAIGSVTLPGSKSISNRTLLLAALAEGVTEVHGLLDSDDTRRMLDALSQLGVVVQPGSAPDSWQVNGVAGQWPQAKADLFLGNAGTAFRPLTAVLALAQGEYHLHGVPRMHERPIADLVDALRQLGAQIDYLGEPGFPPLQIHPCQATASNEVSVRGNVSSQFLTALLMAIPLTGAATTVNVIGELISKPYIEITLNLMARFGVQVQRDGWGSFQIPANQCYQSPGRIPVEGDASTASYFLAAGAIAGGPVRVQGVGAQSIQGDVRFADTLAAMGAQVDMGEDWIEVRGPAHGRLQGLDLDLNHIPDAAMTIAVVALFAEGVTTIRNIASWRVKETDRLAAMATELRKVGAQVVEGEDFLQITPPQQWLAHAEIETYDDHRMAMCFALVALAGVPIRILDPGCTAKTFPTYFQALASITRQEGA
jgi:3-phosphoshikimate 1-carboxyvinyltransferase